jgi:O-antigen/teichoic acid export membrane protein
MPRIFRGALAILGTQPFTWGASLAVAAILPRYLGAHQYGELALVTTIAGLAGVVAAMGVPDYLRRKVALDEGRLESVAWTALVTQLALALGASLVTYVCWLAFGGLGVGGWLLCISLTGVIITAGQAILSSVLVGQERHARFASLNAVGTVLGSLTGILVLISGGGAAGFLGANVLALGLVALVGWAGAGLGVRGASVTLKDFRDLAVGGLPFLGWNVALRIRGEVYFVILSLLLNAQATGWLAAARRIATIPVFIPTLITTPLLPALTRCSSDLETFRAVLRRSVIAVFALTMPLAAMMAALAPLVPEVLGWDAEFEKSVLPLMVLSLGQPLVGLSMVLGTGLIALRKESVWLRVAIVAAVVNPVLNLALIPLFELWLSNGAIGTAVAEAATEVVMLTGALKLLPAGSIDRALLSVLARILLASVCLWMVAALFGSIPLPTVISLIVSSGAGMVTFLAAALAMRCFTRADLMALVTFVRGSLARRGRTGLALAPSAV